MEFPYNILNQNFRFVTTNLNYGRTNNEQKLLNHMTIQVKLKVIVIKTMARTTHC